MNAQHQVLRIRYQIHWESPWHVGSGFGTVGIDRMLRFRVAAVGDLQSQTAQLRIVPYVPGSQLKGVLRHQCERLIDACGLEVAPPHVLSSEPPTLVLENFRPARDSNLLIDRLFGSQYEGESVFVEDALPVRLTGNDWQVYGRTAVDRLVGTVRSGHLFFTQVAIKHLSPLEGRIIARHPPGTLTQDQAGFPYEYALLVAGLLSIDKLGGDKSAGFGACRVHIVQLDWNETTNYDVGEALQILSDPEWAEWVRLVRSESTPNNATG